MERGPAAANKENGRKGGWIKSRKKGAGRSAMHGHHAVGASSSRVCPDLTELRTLRRAGVRAGYQRRPLSCQPLAKWNPGMLPPKAWPSERSVQLGLLCACGRRPIELKGLGCCRLCYYRSSLVALVRRLAAVDGFGGRLLRQRHVREFLCLLECELLDRCHFKTQIEVRMAIFEFIEGWYNPRRRHSAIGYLSPIDYENTHRSKH